MRQERLRCCEVIDKVMFNTESLENNSGRHTFKLLSSGNFDKRKYSVICKYKEYNEPYGDRHNGIQYSPIKYSSSVQIKARNEHGFVVTYEIACFSDSYLKHSITATYNNQQNNSKTYNIVAGSVEFSEFEQVLDDLMPKLDEFSKNFIDYTLNAVLIKEIIKQTPDCIITINSMINDKANKNFKR